MKNVRGSATAVAAAVVATTALPSYEVEVDPCKPNIDSCVCVDDFIIFIREQYVFTIYIKFNNNNNNCRVARAASQYTISTVVVRLTDRHSNNERYGLRYDYKYGLAARAHIQSCIRVVCAANRN